MNIKNFKSLVMDKTGLTNSEYNEFFTALEDKYGISQEDVANQFPDKLGIMDSDLVLSMALPDTSKDTLNVTKYDESIADKLGVDSEIVGKITQWGAAASERLETVENFPFNAGEMVKETIDANGIRDFMGSQREIGKAIDERLTPVAENTAEGAAADAQSLKESKVERLKEVLNRFNGREVEETTVTIDSKFDYYNEDAGVALRGVGDKMHVYTIDKNGDTSLVGKVDCAREDRAEFVSEYKEQIDKVAEADNGWMNLFDGKERVAMEVAQDVSKDIAEEKEIGTGSFFNDIARERTQEKYEELQEKIEDMENKIENMNDGWIKDSMTKLLEKSQEELSRYEERLDEFEKMEVENAKEIKAELEATKAELQAQLEKLESSDNWFNKSMNLKPVLEARLDEIDDRLEVVTDKINDYEKEQKIEKLQDKIQELNTIDAEKQDNDTWFERFQKQVEENAKEFKDVVATEVSEARAGAQSFVANVDNVIGDFRDKVADWAKSISENEHVQNFSESVSNFYNEIQDDLKGIKDASAGLGKDLQNDGSNLWEDIKGVAQDIHQDISDKWDNLVDDVKDWGKNIADKFDFDKDDDVTASIDE